MAGISRIVDYLKIALKLELGTDVGRVNYRGMVFAALLMILYVPNDWLDAAIIITGHKLPDKPTDPVVLLSIWIVGVLLCIGGIYIAAARVGRVAVREGSTKRSRLKGKRTKRRRK